eukprot:scaffold591_cov372-Prasinococcus_capsulatus_cf.AAC.7
MDASGRIMPVGEAEDTSRHVGTAWRIVAPRARIFPALMPAHTLREISSTGRQHRPGTARLLALKLILTRLIGLATRSPNTDGTRLVRVALPRRQPATAAVVSTSACRARDCRTCLSMLSWARYCLGCLHHKCQGM